MKMIRHLKCMLLAMLLLAGFGARAQEDVGLDWAKGFIPANTSSNVVPYGVGTDANGNVYVSGYFSGTVDFNPGAAVNNLTAATGIINAFFVKLDKFGNFIWAKQAGGVANTTSYAIKVDAAGNIYSAGYFTGVADLNPNAGVNNLTAVGAADGYILKLDTNGNYMWAQRLGSPGTEYSHDVDVDAAGNVYVGGHFGPGSASFGGTNLVSAGSIDGYVAKLSPTGVFQWAKRIGGTSGEVGHAVDVDAAGNVYLSGGVTSASTTGMASISGPGGYVIKLNTSGTTVWAHVDNDTGHYRGVTVDSDGNVYAGGVANTYGLVKLNSSGARVWAKKLGISATKMKVGPDNNLYVTGGYDAGSTGFGAFTLPFKGGTADIYAAKLNPAGDVLWAKPFGGAGGEGSLYLSADVPGEVLVTGYFDQTVDFDPGPCVFNLTSTTTDGYNSGYVIKLTSDLLPAGFAVAPSTIGPLTQQACSLGIPNVVTGNAVGVTAPAGYTTPITYQWQKSTSASGPWEDMEGEVFKDLQPLASSESLFYRRIVIAGTNFCGVTQAVDTSAVATVTVSGNTAPTANADGPQWFVCGAGSNTTALNGSASGGAGNFTYQWYQGSSNGGTLVASVANYTTTAVTQATTYTLKVTDAAGCIDTDQVTIVPAVANAGPNQSFCQGSGGVQIGTVPVASPSVKYAWTRVSGSALTTLSCTTCAQPIANPTAVTVYRLTVTTTRKGGATCTTTDDVTITPITAPGSNIAFGGTDKTICVNSTTVLGVATDATYAYTWSPGSYLSSTSIARPTFTAGSSGIDPCSVNYTVTAVKSGCTFVDEVKVSVINSQTSDSGDTECGPRWVTHEGFPNCPEAVYSWSIVSGNGSILSTRNGGEDAYLKSNVGQTTFRRTVTLNGVSCSTDVNILYCQGPGCDIEIETISSQGCPKVFPGEQLRLAPKGHANATDWNYKWSPANLVDNPTAKEVRVMTSSPATITLTITNKYDASLSCSESIDINPAGASQPNIVLSDKNICANSATAIGSAVSGGFAYTWIPSTGLDNPAVNNPKATLTSDQEYIVQIEETASGCITTDTVRVHVSEVVANAGVDRTICNGSTITLGTPRPAGTNWTYSWQPSAAAWTNGTNATMPEPQVEFSATGSQTFILTVTDPASGCTAIDSVTLSNQLTPGEYTGSGVTICQGEEVQLGKAPIAGATYLWTGAGLSCTACSNPVATPTATTKYTLQISYPGCTAPMVDEVTVTVNPVPNVNLNDVYACAPGPVAIGFGANGNPAAPAGATYLWSPSTGLSSTTAANPTANVTAATTYSVVVTLPSGCTFTEELDVIPTAGAGSDIAICSGESTQIGSPALNGATYVWSGAGIVGSNTVAQPTVKPTVTTTYSVSVTRNGCTRTDNVVVTVNSPVAFNISGNTAICVGGNTTLSLVGAPAANTTWQWSPTTGVSDPTSTSTTITATATQTYRLTQTNLVTGCSNFKEVVLVVKPNTISASTTPLAVCAGVTTALPLTVTSTGTYQYVWSPSTGLSNAFVANPTVTTSTDKTYNVVITDTQSQCQLALSVPVTVRPGAECLAPVALRGNVFHDANALVDVTVNKTATEPIPTLYVSLVDSTGAVLKTVVVNFDGSYDFGMVNANTYHIALHQNPAGSATPNLPVGWMNTGENLGAGTGSDDEVSGVLTSVIVRNVDVTNANFGIQQPPLAEPKEYVIDQPVVNQEIPLNGTHVSTEPGTSSPAQMTGTDPEDGVLTGAGKDKTVVITTLADRGELWYNGVLVKTGQVIPNYDPALMVFKATGSGYTSITYEYAYVDQAGVQSPPTTYKISWGKPLPVTLVRFEAKAVETTAALSWTTTAESNSDRFEVQRSLNGKQWEVIGTVNAQGESAATVDYTFRDLTPAGADNYYRLKMIDRDLTFTYSGIRSVSFEVAFETSIFPNPAADKVNLKVTDWKKVASVRISNLAGTNVYKSGRLTSEVIDVKALPEGIYILSITHVDGSVQSHKLVHIK